MLDITPLKNEADEFLYEFQDVQITSKEEYTGAADTLKQIQNKIKKLEEKRLEYTRPLDESKKKITADFKSVIEPLEQFVNEVKKKMLVWAKAEQARLDQEQKKIEAEALEKAKVEHKSEVQVPIVNNTVKTQRGESTTTSIKKVWKWKIVDQNKVPRDYLCVDSPAIVQAIRSGVRFIEGLEIYQEEDLSIRGR